MNTSAAGGQMLRQAGRFMYRVLRDFRLNQGLLLAGAIAYYTFLSIIPMALLTVIVLSHVLEEQQLLQIMSAYTDMIIPGYTVTLTGQLRTFLDNRVVVGVLGTLAMLFFSSLAISMLENAMSVIFFHHFKARSRARHLLVSAVMPYLYLFLIVLGIVMVSLAISAAESLTARLIPLFGWGLTMQGVSGAILYLTGLAGEFLVLSSIYLVMPAVRVSLHYALIGGLTATLLWEGARRLLVWYYSAISMVDLIYGPIALAVGALLSVEVGAIIILLGAQVIAELQAGRDGDAHAGEIEL